MIVRPTGGGVFISRSAEAWMLLVREKISEAVALSICPVMAGDCRGRGVALQMNDGWMVTTWELLLRILRAGNMALHGSNNVNTRIR